MRRALVGCCLFLVSWLFAHAAAASDKKGVGLSDLNAPQRIAALNVAWYYTWKPQPIQGAPLEKFVPMIWGGHGLQKQLAAVESGGKVPVLLAINEPNVVKQANMSVEDVIREWPRIMRLAHRVSSPAASGVLGPWFDKFHQMAEKHSLPYGFMAIHLYGPPNANRFLAKLDAVHEKYGKPIWITEFAVADWNAERPGTNRYSEEVVIEFMKAVLPELERRPFVERYAWFGAGKASLAHEQLRTSRLFEKDGSLTALGAFYAQFN
jgi:hypothetical protein